MQTPSHGHVLAELTEFLRNNFPRARRMSFGVDDNLLDKGIVDSLGLLQIISFIEEAFGVTVNDGVVTEENFGSLGAIASFVMRALGDPSRP